jgi:L,D-transpeptidase YbiS
MTLMAHTGGPAVTIEISLRRQQLRLYEAGRLRVHYPVSTSRYGPGEQGGSLCTPRGRHVIRAMIGRGLPAGAVLQGRRPTGELCSPALIASQPGRDWILSRILWLCGCEPGRNRFGSVDTMQRYIYIHGVPDSEVMGVPFSHGCIRMRNADVIALFSAVRPGTPVEIVP